MLAMTNLDNSPGKRFAQGGAVPPGYVIAKIADSSTVAVPLKPTYVNMPETTTSGYTRFVGVAALPATTYSAAAPCTVMSTPAPVTYTTRSMLRVGPTCLP